MARIITVNFVNDSLASVSGFGSRELLTELRGRAPIWSSLSRAWCTQPHVARDVIAVAESRGYQVVITEDDPLPASMGQLW